MIFCCYKNGSSTKRKIPEEGPEHGLGDQAKCKPQIERIEDAILNAKNLRGATVVGAPQSGIVNKLISSTIIMIVWGLFKTKNDPH